MQIHVVDLLFGLLEVRFVTNFGDDDDDDDDEPRQGSGSGPGSGPGPFVADPDPAVVHHNHHQYPGVPWRPKADLFFYRLLTYF